ncbi:MAG: Cupin domain protein, partial [Berkelbacteria bacterium GW2011_GWA2_38_9]
MVIYLSGGKTFGLIIIGKMKIITKEEANFMSKPEGTKVWYYLRDEYEIHLNEQIPSSTQTWHHHEKICETLF